MPDYQPPCTMSPRILNLVAEIAVLVDRLAGGSPVEQDLRLRRVQRIRTVQGSLAIEGNTLSTEQITAILEGKLVIAPPAEIQEARNAILAYDALPTWQADREPDLLSAHRVLMAGLIDNPGAWRSGGVGIMKGSEVIHLAPPAGNVPFVEFMLTMIRAALQEAAPQVAPGVTPEVERLIAVLTRPMSRHEIQLALGLRDEKNIRLRYIQPALEAGVIERTIPEKPNSRLQKYRRTLDRFLRSHG